MKLKKLYIQEYKNLVDINIDFAKSHGKTLIIGTNGSGKSNLLEVLSAIFSALYNEEKSVAPGFRFELEYFISPKDSIIDSKKIESEEVLVKIRNVDGNIEVSYCELTENNDYIIINSKHYDNILPEHVIAVYSGEEQRLWEDYYFKSYDLYNKQYMGGRTAFSPQKMVYLNRYYWNLIASVLAIHSIDKYREFLENKIGIRDINSINLTFDTNKVNKNKNERAKHIIELINPEHQEIIQMDLETYERVRDYCGYEADLFYNMAVLTLYKDFKIITDFIIKCNNGIEIKNLSEGEKKLLLIIGAINILSGDNLFLLDEPDAHLHEGRKREIFDIIQEDFRSQFVISSHSPTMTKMFAPENVVFLDKKDDNCVIHYGDISKTISRLTNGEWSYIDQSLLFESSRPLILVEGPGDVKYIRKAIDVLSNENDNYKVLKNCEMMHCGGASNIQRTIDEIADCLPSKKTVIAVYDRDDAGGTELKKAINKGRDKNDNKTYKSGQIYYFKLPKTRGYKSSTFVIEDYFSINTKKVVTQSIIDNINEDFNSIPKDLKQKVKDKLFDDMDTYDKKTLSGFTVLLDKLLNIINNNETVEEV